jgi:hypothetical protein
MSTAADELRAASARLRELAAAVEADIATNPYWASEEYPPHDYPNLYARGVDNGLGGPAGVYAAALHPGVGAALAGVFDAWARMADVDPDLMHRVGGRETLALARLINTGSQP